jgi:hypothetical protein
MPPQVGPTASGEVATGRSPLVGGLPKARVGFGVQRPASPGSVAAQGAAVGVQRRDAHSAARQDRVAGVTDAPPGCGVPPG